MFDESFTVSARNVAIGEDGDIQVENGEMTWKCKGKSITVEFQKGKVFKKSQTGLK